MKRSADRTRAAEYHTRRSPRGVARHQFGRRSTTLILLLLLVSALALVALLLASAHPNHTAASVGTTETPATGGAPHAPRHELAQWAQSSTFSAGTRLLQSSGHLLPSTSQTSGQPLIAGGSQSTIVGPRDLPVPVLMYHIIAHPAPGAAYPLLWLPVPSFQAQMQYLRAHGFHPVTLQQVYDFWNGEGVLPIRPVVLTFDDGYRSVFAAAVPLLHRYHWPAVLNLALSHLGDHRDLWPWMVQTMIAWGWEVDSHTLTHVDVTTLPPAEQRAQIAGSRERLQKEFHVPVNFFCYPAGRYDASAIAQVQAAGYLGATTTDPGLATPARRYTLPRIRINGDETLAAFAATVQQAAAAQAGVERVTSSSGGH